MPVRLKDIANRLNISESTVSRALSDHPRISDKTAEGGYEAINKTGMMIPDDFSIIGYDDIPEAKYFSPPLTTTGQPKYDLGAKSMQLLIDNLYDNKEKGSKKIRLLPELIIRKSIKSIHQ